MWGLQRVDCNRIAEKEWRPGSGKAGSARPSWGDFAGAGWPAPHQSRARNSPGSVPSHQLKMPMPLLQLGLQNWSHAQHLNPESAQASPQAAQCTGRESPNGNAFATRAARNAAPERWSDPNPRQMCRRQAKGCPRRGIGLQPYARGRLSSGPWCNQFPYQLVTASMVRKDSPEVSVEKLRNPSDFLAKPATSHSYSAMPEIWKREGCLLARRRIFSGNSSRRTCEPCFASSCSGRCQKWGAPGPRDGRSGPGTRKCRCRN